jgi:hypothetical protein
MLSSLLEWMATEEGRAAVARFELKLGPRSPLPALSAVGAALRAFLNKIVK